MVGLDLYVYKMTTLDTLDIIPVCIAVQIHVTLTTRTCVFAHI